MSDQFLSAVSSFAVLLGLYVLGSFAVPFLFWHLPAFKDIKATKDVITKEVFDVAFKGHAWEFTQRTRESSRMSVYVHSSSSQEWITTQIEELTNILTAMCALQAIGVLIALFNQDKANQEFHLLIHLPVPEMIFLLVMVYLLHKMGRHWLRTKSNFRLDAWQ